MGAFEDLVKSDFRDGGDPPLDCAAEKLPGAGGDWKGLQRSPRSEKGGIDEAVDAPPLHVTGTLNILQGRCDMAQAPGPDHDKLFETASEQAGYFTSEQARRCGFTWDLLSHHTRRGNFQRVRRGLYRLPRFPSSPYEEVIAAWLGFDPKKSVVSHETALQLFDLADVVPTTIHLTAPRSHRSRKPPPGVTVHTALEPPERDGIVIRNGVRVTAPALSIADSAAYGTAPEQVARAAREALTRGLATQSELLAAARRHGGRAEKLIRRAVKEVRRG